MKVAVALSLAIAMLAGCAGSPEPSEEPALDPSVITDPRDFSDANSTGAHLHDYWGGADELEVMDSSRGSSYNTVDDWDWRVYLSPPDEKVVPQGTASLTIVVDWTDQAPVNRYAEVSLWVKPANSAEHRFVKEVVRDETVEVPVLYEEADLPHQLISAWEFMVQYNSTEGASAFFGSTHLKVVAHRGLELQPFPAHPDRWEGRTSFELLTVQSSFRNVGYTGTGSVPARYRPENGTLVPSDAARVDVVLKLGNTLPAGGLQLSFHGADSRSFTALEPEADQGGEQRFTIPVEPGMGDGPYNNASLWEFRLYTKPASPGDDPSVYDGTYELSAIVHKV